MKQIFIMILSQSYEECVATPHLRHCTEAFQSNLLLLFPGVPSQTVHVEEVLQLSIYESTDILETGKNIFHVKTKIMNTKSGKIRLWGRYSLCLVLVPVLDDPHEPRREAQELGRKVTEDVHPPVSDEGL